MKKKRIYKITGLGIALLAIVLAMGFTAVERFSENIINLETKKLDSAVEKIDKKLFEKNIYLRPDTTYFYKLETCLQYGKLDQYNGYIQKNLMKAAKYDSNIYTIYTALADEEAPYLLVNGVLREKASLIDTDWWTIAADMEEDCYLDWRESSSSFLNKVDLLTVYRVYDSEDYFSGEIIRGYMVVNYYRKSLLNELANMVSKEERIVLYNAKTEEFLFQGEYEISEDLLESLLVRGKNGEISENKGMMNSGEEKVIYSIARSAFAPLYYVMLKEDYQIEVFTREMYPLLLGIVLFVCIGIMAFLILYYNQYRKYLKSLVKILNMEEENEPGENEMMMELANDFKSREVDLTIIAQRILEDSEDISELKRIVSSERELRTEVEMLYGNAQINSHFLLNTLDTIYWESMKNNGQENEETQMLERLCIILKYALDSSTPFIALKEEVECAKDYLAIQSRRKRKRIETKWRIPKELEGAKVGKLMLQPILENSIQHGGKDGEEPLNLIVEAKVLEGDTLYLSVSDNGNGMELGEIRRMNQIFRKDTPVKSKHIGLLNVNRRIQLQFGEEYGIILKPSKEGEGLTVVMRLKYLLMED